MSEKQTKTDDRVNSVLITDNDSGNTYELDFCRDSIRFAEQRGFILDDVPRFPATKWYEFFFYAFRMHHRNMARNQTDALLDKYGGMTPSLLDRLIDLYNQALVANNAGENVYQEDEDAAKNSHVTVELL